MSDDSNLLQMINQKLDRLLSRGERKPAPAPEPPPPPRERRPAFEWLKKQPDERHEDWLRRCNITDADNGLCIDMARAGREHDARMRARPMRRPSEEHRRFNGMWWYIS